MVCNFYILFGSYNAYIHKYPLLVMEFNKIYINICYVRCTLGHFFTHTADTVSYLGTVSNTWTWTYAWPLSTIQYPSVTHDLRYLHMVHMKRKVVLYQDIIEQPPPFLW